MNEDAFDQLLRQVALLPDPVIARRVDRFEILGELGRGGFGVVYEARDVELGRHVALKMLPPFASPDPALVALFRAEAEAVARLGHPHVVTLFDFGMFEGRPYLVFERLRGITLERRLRNGPLEQSSAIDVAVGVLRGLAHAHREHVIHRDIKPANVFLVDDGPVKLLDFGLASALAARARGGTPGYMAPEQVADAVADARTDVWATGVILREMVSTPSEPLARVIGRATAEAPSDRYADARAMLDELVALRVAASTGLAPARVLADRRDEVRHARFVGRDAERSAIRRALRHRDGPRIFLVHGIAGIGKTSLLHELAHVAAETGAGATYLDGRDVEGRPQGFLAALASALGVPSERSPLDALCAQRAAHLLLVDGFDALAPLAGWLYDWLLPRLPDDVVVVLAGRDVPARDWLVDPAWRELVSVVKLGELDPSESVTLLERRGLDPARYVKLLELAHGHPLALAMGADMLARGDELGGQRDLVRALVQRFRECAPSPAHREALEAAAVLRTVDEPLLGEVLDHPAGELFEWLASLSFVTSQPRGLAMHDLVRELVISDLRWRALERHAAIVGRAHASLARRLETAEAREQLRLTCELMFVHDHHPAISQFTHWQGVGDLVVSSATARDAPEIIALVEKHEGRASAELARYWLDRQLDGVQIIRDPAGLAGFVATVTLTRARPDEIEHDPVTRGAMAAIGTQHGRTATMFRFWMSRDGYQTIDAVQSLCSALMVRHQLTTPSLAWTLFPCANPDAWAPHMEFIRAVRLREADFDVGKLHFGIYAHDFRASSPATWLRSLLESGPP